MNKIEKLHEKAINKIEYGIDAERVDVWNEGEAIQISTQVTKDIAIKFSEWLQENRWFAFINGKWHYTFEEGTSISKESYNKNYIKTTEELFNKFLETL